LLRVSDIAVRFGGVHALQGVSLDFQPGAVTGLIGPNGAGKTTMFNVMTGLQRATAGTVLLEDTDITSASPQARARLGVARTYQRVELFGTLTARENVLVAAEVQRGWSRSRTATSPRAVADELIERTGLAEVADVPADVLPTGMARLVELARALASKPRVLLLDEPSSGLSVPESRALGDLLVELAGEGIAVLLVEHDMDLVMRVCGYLHVLDFGEAIAGGTPAEIRRDPRVQQAYLGAAPIDEEAISAAGLEDGA
jgi:branched-chain amino acid transport system ATP-binding protein